MKKNFYIITLLCGVIAFPLSGYGEEKKPENTLVLTLQDAIAIAFKNNKEIQIQAKEVDVAQAKLIGVVSEFLPHVNLNAEYTHNGSVLPIPGTNIKKDPGVFAGYENDNKVSTTITQTIYNGRANMASLKQAQLGLQALEETLRAAKLDVEFETKRLYYGLLLAFETERIAQDLVNQAQAHYEDVSRKFDQGSTSRFDVLQSKVQVSIVTPELINAKNAVTLIEAQLKKLLGLKMQDAIRLKGVLTYYVVDINESEFLQQAYLTKPEMILKSLGVDVDKWGIQVAKAQNRPQISADGEYFYRSNNWSNMFNTRHNNWNVGVSVSIPVFDGFSSKAKVDEAKARYVQATLEKENVTEQIAVDIKKACLDLQQAKAIIDASKDNVEEAKEALHIAEVSYDNGAGTNLDIIDSQTSLSQIEQNYSEGIYDYLMAKASLDRTMGNGTLVEVKNAKKD